MYGAGESGYWEATRIQGTDVACAAVAAQRSARHQAGTRCKWAPQAFEDVSFAVPYGRDSAFPRAPPGPLSEEARHWESAIDRRDIVIREGAARTAGILANVVPDQPEFLVSKSDIARRLEIGRTAVPRILADDSRQK